MSAVLFPQHTSLFSNLPEVVSAFYVQFEDQFTLAIHGPGCCGSS